jgi:hypothetical protein
MIKKLFARLFLLIPFALIAIAGNSQESELGNWFIYFGNKKINPKWNWHNEVQYRNYNFIGDLEQLLIRTGIGYNLSENNNNLLLGYGFILSQNYIDGTDNKVDVIEHRIYQQFITRQNFSRFFLQHRYRFEQRFIENDFSLRFRYFLGLNVSLNNTEMIDNTWYISIYNEIFLNTTGQIFDRNRLYGGIGYKLNKVLRLEVAYMNQFLQSGGRDQINLVAFVNF